MFSLLVTALLIAVALLAIAAFKPELVKRAAAWLVAAGVIVSGWMNADFIQGLF